MSISLPSNNTNIRSLIRRENLPPQSINDVDQAAWGYFVEIGFSIYQGNLPIPTNNLFNDFCTFAGLEFETNMNAAEIRLYILARVYTTLTWYMDTLISENPTILDPQQEPDNNRMLTGLNTMAQGLQQLLQANNIPAYSVGGGTGQ